MRTIQLLNDNWRFVRSADSPEAAAQATGAPVTLPHTWNAEDGQDGGNDYYRGRCWYVRPLSVPAPAGEEQVWLQVDGAAMTADVYLNGRHLAHHEGGYSTFRVELTPFLQGADTLAVAVDNSDNDRVYPQKADFTFYGGLYRDVSLLTVPAAHFALTGGVPGLRVTPEVAPDLKSAAVTVEAQVECGEGRTVSFTVAGMRQSAVVQGGAATARFTLCPVRLWDGTADPYLYTATAALDSGDAVSARFGCRRFAVDPQRGFLLNGRPYPLRGVSRHQDRRGAGNALTYEMHREDMEILQEIGANTVRLAHYQHAQAFYDLCDENGIVAWAEIPFITMHMENGRENTLSQMRELVTQCYNHPSIVCWGLSNEITAASAVNEAFLENHRALNDLCHSLDKTRPPPWPTCSCWRRTLPFWRFPTSTATTSISAGTWATWSRTTRSLLRYHANYPDRVIGLSEYGADANPAYQSAHPEQGDYTEGFQCVYHEHLLQMMEKRPWLWATHVWNLFDFAADGRDEGGKHGENQKGLVTFDRKTKKDAFYLYKAYWNKREPFVHLCGSRYVDRTEDVTEVVAYSNQNAVELLVDGKQFATLEGSHIFKFAVPISGSHTIEARAGDCTSVILVRHVDAPNLDYTLPGRQSVTNWFDAGETNPACFSVEDKLSVLQSDSRAGEIVDRMMNQGASSRGDVADAVKDNPGLLRMMGRMTLLSLLKQGGAEEAQVQQLNRVLQTIPKPEQPEE
ncbi:MAG: glycoside hydrolase family 2 protein [Clostridiales bacterium]|nr:glycoside hydrolase family 2 protein [Clostridiales bacterium]